MGSNPNASRRPVHPVIDQLRSMRVAKGLSQADLAEKLGYAKNTVNRSEGGVKAPDFRFIVDYADYLGYDLELSKRT